MSNVTLKERFQSLVGKITAGRTKPDLGRKQVAALAVTVAALGIYAVSKGEDAASRKLVNEREAEFKRARMLGDPYSSVARAKEKRL